MNRTSHPRTETRLSANLKRCFAFILLLGITTTLTQIYATEKSVHQGLLNDYKPQQLTDNVWMIEGPRAFPNPQNQGFMNNPGFIVTENSVIVIDPGSSAAIGRALIAHIKQQTDNPITHVFASHVHGDHWLANHAIQEEFPDAKFYGHPKMITQANEGSASTWLELMDSLTEGATQGTQAVIPTEALANEQLIKVDNITVKAHLAQKKAHTTSDVMYEIMEDKVLFAGDNINHRRIVRMDDGSFIGNIAAAKYALDLDVDTIIPGHGPSGDKQVLQMYHDYLSTVYSSVQELREDELEAFEMKPEITKRLSTFIQWSGFSDELGKHISLANLEAEEEDF